MLKILLTYILVPSSISELMNQSDCGSRQCSYNYYYYLYERYVTQVSSLIRNSDGQYNNLLHPFWGSGNQTLTRVAPSAFQDGRMFPSGEQRPSARLISNQVCDIGNQTVQTDPRKLSGLFLVWGQFFGHEIDHTLVQNQDDKQSWPINIPQCDPFFDPQCQGYKTIPFVRSVFDQKLSINHPRQQINRLTSWFDGQVIYKQDLRTGNGGQLKISDQKLLTKNQQGIFVTGDPRVNQNIVLISLNTLFVRQHNRLCKKISQLFPEMNDDQLYNYGKNYIGALIAKITYDDYLPLLLSQTYNLGQYNGYEPQVDPSITNVFSTAATRFGHFTVPDNVIKMNNDGEIIQEIRVRDSIFNPSLIENCSDIGQILKGQANNPMKKRTIKMSNELRNFLIPSPGNNTFLDLAAINIQRGRDHGLPDFNTFRRFFGMKQFQKFQQITSDEKTIQKLKNCFKDINLVDSFIGFIAQESLPGAVVGQLSAAIIKHTMHRIRAADRFWYQNVFPETIKQQIKETTLADIIRRNTEINNIQDNVFIVPGI